MKKLHTIGNMLNCRHFRPHSHSKWEMIYYTRGKVRLSIDGQAHLLFPRTFVCQPPKLIHEEEGLDTFDNYHFIVDDFNTLPNKEIIIQDTANEAIGSQIKQMHIAFVTKPLNYLTICESHLHIITQYVLSQLQEDATINPYIKQYTNALISNASNCDFKISHLEKTVPFSFDHFRRLFNEAMGCTPIEYLTHIRINKAKQLLNHEYNNYSLSISDIALITGFSDPLYFSRCFKKNTGMSPSEWIDINFQAIK